MYTVDKVNNVIERLNISKESTKPLLRQLDDIVALYLEYTDRDSKLNTRIYQHSLRTMKIAERIMKKEKCDRDVVLCSLILHDIGKTLTEKRHDIVSFTVAKEILERIKIDDIKKAKILDCILYHSSKQINSLNLTIEQKVVMDADILDEIGILSITKYCSAKVRDRNCSTMQILKGLEDKYDEVEKETSLLKTKYGLDLYNKRKKFLRGAIDDFKFEIDMFKI